MVEVSEGRCPKAVKTSRIRPIVNVHHADDGEDQSTASPRLILVHYMPWFEADAGATQWGWHWTMNQYDPSVVNNDRREIASKYYPAIGPYDSSDPHVIEYHL